MGSHVNNLLLQNRNQLVEFLFIYFLKLQPHEKIERKKNELAPRAVARSRKENSLCASLAMNNENGNLIEEAHVS